MRRATVPVILVAVGGGIVAGAIAAILPLTRWHGLGYWMDCLFAALVGVTIIFAGADLLEQSRRR